MNTKTDQPKVFIIILNFNNLEVLNDCLQSVSEIDYPNFDIILVDNNSTDGSLEKAKNDFPQVKYLRNKKNLGFSAGNNAGIRYATEKGAEFILLLNSDTLVEKDFLDKLIEEAKREPRAGILCPLIYGADKKKIWFSGGRIDWLRMKTVHQTSLYQEGVFDSSFISGCAMLIPTKVFEKAGLLDERYFLYWEDADFCVQVRKTGFRTVVVPASVICHLEVSEKANNKKVYWLVLSGLKFFKKNAPFLIRPWLWFYVKIRKSYNWLKRNWGKDERAVIVHEAFKDFENKN